MTQEVAIRTNQTILTIPEDFSVIRANWLQAKEKELADAQTALLALSESEASERRVRRTRERVNLLKRVLRALKNGYVPIPRFNSIKLTMDFEELPLAVISAVNEAKAQGLFDEFRLIEGQQAINRRGRLGRLAQRDPMVVGVVRTPEIVTRTWANGSPRETWSGEEHFLLAWWRPEDERDENMF